MEIIKGIPVSDGYGIGQIVIKNLSIEVPNHEINDPSMELERMDIAVKNVSKELKKMYLSKLESLGKEYAEIFKAHELIINDPEWLKAIKKYIVEKNVNVEKAVLDAGNKYAHMFEIMDNTYMQQRASDIHDVKHQLIQSLMGAEGIKYDMYEQAIIVSKDLTPSDTANLDAKKVIGFITEIGGKTSHSAIIARAMGIPAVMGIKNICDFLKDGQWVIVDGFSGHIIIDPDEACKEDYDKKFETYKSHLIKLKAFKDLKLETKTGKPIEVSGNIAKIEEVSKVLENGGDGIGLFRSEFLFMDRDHPPTEEEQFKAYKEVLSKMKPKPVIIRTMDLGGDKSVSYLDIEEEMNPFLGFRAIRYCLQHPDLLKTQLRALLRSSVFGHLRIMFPMVSTLKEIQKLKALFNICKEELYECNIDFSESIEIGIMIEVPSAAIMSDVLAQEVDFFSIGTNDLTQYTMAADRMNSQVDNLYNNDDPAVLRLIEMTILNAHKAGIWCGMCGAAAGDPKLVPLFLKMGLDEFSMSPGEILRAKSIISDCLKQETCP